jgi:hypothetical protein
MDRLELLQQQLSAKQPSAVRDSYDFYYLADLLTPEENALRLKVRAFLEKEVQI